MATKRSNGTRNAQRKANPNAQPTGNWFTDAMSEANAAVVRNAEARQRKARRARKK